MWERVRTFLSRRCQNHAGSGYGGTVRESQNMDAVVDVLKREGVAVRVFSAEGVDAWQAGRFDGFWMLGQECGHCLGSLLWCKDHVYVLCDEMSSEEEMVSTGVMPWVSSVVRGKKGKTAHAKAARAEQLLEARRARRVSGSGAMSRSVGEVGEVEGAVVEGYGQEIVEAGGEGAEQNIEIDSGVMGQAVMVAASAASEALGFEEALQEGDVVMDESVGFRNSGADELAEVAIFRWWLK